jgi:hypothetical protein
MTGRGRRPLARLLGVAFFLAALLSGPSPTLWAQSTEAPATGSTPAPATISPSDAAPKTETPVTGEEDVQQERQRAYRRQKDDLKRFAPSEEIRVDKAVDFPADI